MKKLALITCLLLCSSGLLFAQRFHNQKVIGYIPDYGDASQVDYTNLTHAIFCFVFANPDGSLMESQPFSVNRLQTYLNATAASGCKRLISMTGANLGKVSSNSLATAKLCDTLVKYCQHYGFEGLDLDWEGLSSTQDSSHYKTLVDVLSQRLHEEELTFVITVGFGDYSGQWFPDVALRKADWLQIMAYDAAGTWSTSPMDNHSSFQHLLNATEYWRKRGYAKHDLVMGVPFYGYKFPSVAGGIGTAQSYRSIVAAYPDLKDEENRTPGNDLTCYNGADLIRRKSRFLIDSSYAGIFMWEMTQDATGDQSLHKQIVCAYEDETCHLSLTNTSPDVTTGLIANWQFNGQAADNSGNGYNGVVTNVTLSNDRFGNVNGAYRFGAGSRIDMGDAAAFDVDDFTVSAWIYPDPTSYTGIQPIVAKFDSYPAPFSFYLENGKLMVYLLSKTPIKEVIVKSYVSLLPGQWYHVVLTHNSAAGTKMYVNANWQNEDLQPLHTYLGEADQVRIGASANNGFQFYGIIDDVRFYQRALDFSSIDSLYRMPNQTVTPVKNTLEQWGATLYPNPSKGSFTLSLTEAPKEKARLILTNAVGNTLKEWNVSGLINTYAAPWPDGIYYLTLWQGDQVATQKLVIVSTEN